MNILLQDLRSAWRTARRFPVPATVAVLLLAVGIGVNSALFTVISATLLRPLPFDRAAELYSMESTYQGQAREFAAFAHFQDWRAENKVFTQVAAYRAENASITTRTGAEYLPGAAVSADFFTLLRVQPFLGRQFLPVEDEVGGGKVVMLSHSLWLRRFGGDPGVIGNSVTLQSQPHTVIGVLPKGFAFPDDVELWRPLTLTASRTGSRIGVVRVIARLRADVSRVQAQAEMGGIARQLEQSYPQFNANWGIELVELGARATERIERLLLPLWAAVACVLLIACSNVGIILLSRGVQRGPEFAVRAALGASRARLVRQLLTEGLLLGLLGGIGGVLLAQWGVVALRELGPPQLASVPDIQLDSSVVIFTALLSVATGFVVGLVPAWRVARLELHAVVREDGRSHSSSRVSHRFMRSLAMGQLAVSFVLLFGAGLMLRTLGQLQAVPIGFNADRLLTFYVSLPETQYREPAELRAFYDVLLERLRTLPGVQSASALNALYIHWSNAYVVPLLVEGRPAPDRSSPPDTHVRIVDSEIHRVLQVPILRGRALSKDDGPDTPQSVVINETMATRYFSGQDPIGQRISVMAASPGQPTWQRIVGVVGDARQRGPDADAFPEVQIPFRQSPVAQMAIVVKTTSSPDAMVGAIRGQVTSLDGNLPMMFVQTMDEVVAKSLGDRRLGARLLSIFALVALLLTAAGLYGVTSALMGDRAREIAVRLALGASPKGIAGMVTRQMLTVVATGIAVGAAIAAGLARHLRPLLFGVTPADPATFAMVAVFLAIVAMMSGYWPVRRVTRADPSTTLRE